MVSQSLPAVVADSFSVTIGRLATRSRTRDVVIIPGDLIVMELLRIFSDPRPTV